MVLVVGVVAGWLVCRIPMSGTRAEHLRGKGKRDERQQKTSANSEQPPAKLMHRNVAGGSVRIVAVFTFW
jgi:hypothetical protein